MHASLNGGGGGGQRRRQFAGRSAVRASWSTGGTAHGSARPAVPGRRRRAKRWIVWSERTCRLRRGRGRLASTGASRLRLPYDYLRFHLDGISKPASLAQWDGLTCRITSIGQPHVAMGIHDRWQRLSGFNAGWVDGVQFTSGPPPPPRFDPGHPLAALGQRVECGLDHERRCLPVLADLRTSCRTWTGTSWAPATSIRTDRRIWSGAPDLGRYRDLVHERAGDAEHGHGQSDSSE